MKISFEWLKDYINIENKDVSNIGDSLCISATEVEEIQHPRYKRKTIVIVEIKSVIPHPNAHSLSLCQVSDGSKLYQIVCGANNLTVGSKYPLAKVGAFLPNIDLKIKQAKIRGETSLGMLCSQRELGLSDEHSGIAELPNDAPVGCNFFDYIKLNEYVYDIKVLPNRGDCLSVLGVAREISCLLSLDLKSKALTKVDFPIVENNIKLDIDTSAQQHVLLCYLQSLCIKNIVPSPLWLKARLTLSEKKSNNPLEDIANYIMLDIGQPLHIFDLDKIKGNTITFDLSHGGEKFLSLDNKEYTLKPNMLVLKDSSDIISVAGTIGSKHTGIDKNTKNILVESALFSPQIIAFNSRNLQLTTESSYRFERGVDRNNALKGLEYFKTLISNVSDVTKVGKIISSKKNIPPTKAITFDPKDYKKNISSELDLIKIGKMLTKLGFTYKKNDKKMLITPPSWRWDIKSYQNIQNEILRITNLNLICAKKLKKQFAVEKQKTWHNYTKTMMDTLCHKGYNQLITWSFIKPKWANLFLDKDIEHIHLLNPEIEGLSVLRSNLLPNLLLAVNDNNQENISIFEVGKTYFKQNNKIIENEILAFVTTSITKKNILYKQHNTSILDVKADVLALFAALNINTNNIKFIQKNIPNYLHPHRATQITQHGQIVGYFGAIHPLLKNAFSFDIDVFYTEILLKNIDYNDITNKEFVKYPLQETTRDFSLINVENNLPKFYKIKEVIKQCSEIIKKVLLIDIYEVEKNKKNVITIRIKIQPIKNNLSIKEINKICEQILFNLKNQLGLILNYDN